MVAFGLVAKERSPQKGSIVMGLPLGERGRRVLVASEHCHQQGYMIIALSPGERGDPPWRVGEG